MTRKSKSQLQLPGSPFGMDLKPRDVTPQRLRFTEGDFRGVYDYFKGIDDINDVVDLIESGEGVEGIADAWGVSDAPIHARSEQSNEVERLTQEFLEKGGEITRLKDQERSGVFDGWD